MSQKALKRLEFFELFFMSLLLSTVFCIALATIMFHFVYQGW